MIAVQRRTAKHLVLSRLAGGYQPLSEILKRVQDKQQLAGQAVLMSQDLLRRHLNTLAEHGYAEAEGEQYRLSPLGELTLIRLGEWAPRWPASAPRPPLMGASL